MSKHKALELAGKLYDNGEVPSLEECCQAAAELRAMHDREQRQHALIVQMREALANFGMTVRQRYTDEGQELLDAAAAADRYLEEKA